jgi:radical SAM superfamily enzyme YgiQ (UPF0313 family)
MRVLFVNPPFRNQRYSRSQRSPGVIKSGTMYYPYWLAHGAALCEAKGHTIGLLDCPADSISREGLLRRTSDFAPELVVIETSTPSFRHDLETVTALKSKAGDLRVCLVGTHATADWATALEECPALDFVAIGEYDFVVLDLANAPANAGRNE